MNHMGSFFIDITRRNRSWIRQNWIRRSWSLQNWSRQNWSRRSLSPQRSYLTQKSLSFQRSLWSQRSWSSRRSLWSQVVSGKMLSLKRKKTCQKLGLLRKLSIHDLLKRLMSRSLRGYRSESWRLQCLHLHQCYA